MIVCCIRRAEDQRDRLVARQSGQIFDGAVLFRLLQFLSIANAELVPFEGIMAEPFAQLRARSEIFSPRIKPQKGFLAASWPHAVHENP